MDFMQGVFYASFGGVSSRIEPEELDQLQAAFYKMQDAERVNALSKSVKYVRNTAYNCYSSGYIIEKQTEKTVIIRAYHDGHTLENCPADHRQSYYLPHKKVTTIDPTKILYGHTPLTVAAYEKALTFYNDTLYRINNTIRDRFARDLVHEIYNATSKEGQRGVYLHT